MRIDPNRWYRARLRENHKLVPPDEAAALAVKLSHNEYVFVDEDGGKHRLLSTNIDVQTPRGSYPLALSGADVIVLEELESEPDRCVVEDDSEPMRLFASEGRDSKRDADRVAHLGHSILELSEGIFGRWSLLAEAEKVLDEAEEHELGDLAVLAGLSQPLYGLADTFSGVAYKLTRLAERLSALKK